MLLIPLALIGYFIYRRQKGTAIVYSDATILATLPVTMMLKIKRIVPWILYGGMVLAILALARPQQGLERSRVRTEGIAMEMCIDRSGSMKEDDFILDRKRVDRLTAVKSVFRDFVEGDETLGLQGRPNDLIGLIAFGGFADAKCPLTLDHEALVQILDTIQVPAPIRDRSIYEIDPAFHEQERLTAIGDALVLAVDRLKDSKAKSKVIVLLSDGASNTGVVKPEEAVEAAKAYGIKIYTIGIGDPNPARLLRMPRGPMLQPGGEMDEATLKMLANETGGKYFLATTTGALEKVYAEINQLEKTKIENRVYREYAELYHMFLLPGLCLITLQVVLVSTRFRSLP
ncbi:MAG: VWA domain-containing protein [Planctomycetia bacterium]